MKTKLIVIGGLLLFLVSPQISAAATLDLPLASSGGVEVSSATHPDSDHWYPKSDLTVSWNRPNAAFGFSFKLDQISDTVPDNTLDTTITTTKAFPDLEDGTWYFHIKARSESLTPGFGETTHFKVQIDTTAPSAFDIKLVPSEDQKPTKRPVVSFAAMDASSGIDHYEMQLDGHEVAALATSPYKFDPINAPGSHTIEVKALDQAGNSQSARLVVEVPESFSMGFLSQTMTLPVYELVALNLLILLLIVLILILIHRRQKQPLAEPLVPTLVFPLSESEPVITKKPAKPRRRAPRRKPVVE